MKNEHGTIHSYIVGFVLSLLLTLSSYLIVVEKLLPQQFILGVILMLALMQLVVQLIFFLHLDKEKGSRWNLVFFVSTFSIVFLVTVASLWIMGHLNYNMMPQEVNNFMLIEEGIKK